jgi:hypothetical protein
MRDCFDPIRGRNQNDQKAGAELFQNRIFFYGFNCFCLAKQVWTVGNKTMYPCAHQKGIKVVVYKRGRKQQTKWRTDEEFHLQRESRNNISLLIQDKILPKH